MIVDIDSQHSLIFMILWALHKLNNNLLFRPAAVSFGKKRLAIFKSYGTITTPWGGMKLLPWERENRLTHVFDPCWNQGRRLPAEEENLPAPADGSKTGSEKPLENPASATLGKVNSKWS